ncbi:hypothetical protein MACH24_09510 [Erythrobacter sp. Dej080120_24]|uniref:hypothetical protein n=1 Tax=Erythrobacter sp. Dej080120_24 TaxID=3024837 RepID=UPI002920FAAA|nr:hypothetical protein MACH24_09510 [Erythrobacter sp. Dej080120_24]
MINQLDWILLSGRRAKGKRPTYFEDPDLEKTFAVLMALVAEVSVLRERLDTVERLLETKGSLNRSDIENYRPDLEAGKERGRATQAYISRVMRIFQQEVEALKADDLPLSEWVEKLAKE